MKSWQAYPAYKPSGVEWLGEIPRHWSTAAVKFHFDIQLGKMLQNHPGSAEDVLTPYAKALHVGWGKVETSDLPEMYASPTDMVQYGLKNGDLLVCEGGEVGRAGIVTSVPSPCIIQNALHRVRAKRTGSVGFLKYVLEAVSSSEWFEVLCNRATIAHFTREKFADLPIPIPTSVSEQRAIAAFLDRETERIDALIALKERQIELLQEKRAALISHAITKGLTLDVPLKDSGFKWLGEVPQHWRVERLKWVARMESGHTPDKKVSEYWEDCTIPWVSLRDTGYLREHDYIGETAVYVNEAGLANSSAHVLPARVVLFTRDASIGLSAITTRPMAVSQHIIAWVCGPHLLPEYLLRVFYTMTQELERLTMGSTIKTVGMPDVQELVTPVPPIAEQIAIAQWIEDKTSQLDQLVSDALLSISYLREYRTALISAAVTGKIDVRQEVELAA